MAENKEQPKLNIQKKISRARVMLQEKELKKTGYNKYSNYTYFELGDFLPHINRICDELGLYCEFQFEANEAKLTITDSDKIEDFKTWSTPVEIAILKGCSAIQNIGGTQSFARRYLYIMAFEIAESDSIEGGEVDQEAEQGKQKINKASVFTIKSLLDETHSNEKKFLEWAGVSKIEDITNAALGTCINKLNRIKEKLEKEKKDTEKENIIPEQIDF
ncbi:MULTISPECIES: ERF family protein [Clostridium]|uniref:Recombinase n=2 Tax=Clostridium TaxID=1485 RepID=A0A0B5Q9C6_CLOBE|nr:ERF family protein [Clostridium beijerinckii]AJG98834.1 recombinase [Clostridium beijerinckii]